MELKITSSHNALRTTLLNYMFMYKLNCTQLFRIISSMTHKFLNE